MRNKIATNKRTVVTEGLRSISDRMLRYEVTFRNSHFSYVHNRKFFAIGCPILGGIKARHNKAKSVFEKCMRVAKKESEVELEYVNPKIKRGLVNEFMDEYNRLTAEVKRNYKIFESNVNLRCSFRLGKTYKTFLFDAYNSKL